jgi:hypothetical protein
LKILAGILVALVLFSVCLDPGAVGEAPLGQPRIFSVRQMKVRQGINLKMKELITILALKLVSGKEPRSPSVGGG